MPKQQVRQWYKIATAAASKADEEPTSAEVLIYDYIDPFGVSAQDFVNDIKALDVDQLDVRINSPGGSAFDGIAIFNALKRHPATVTTYNDGLAASAASFIAQAGDKRVTSKYAETMVHGPSAIAIGKPEDMRAVAAQLDRRGGNMAQLYADACGGTVDDWLAVMNAETWYTGEEAVEAGLFDEVETTDDGKTAAASKKAGTAAAAASFDYSMFRYAGRQAAPAPFATATAPTKENLMAETKPDEATKPTPDDTKPDETKADEAKPEVPAGATPVAPAASAAPAGTVVVDAEMFAALQARAKLGEQAHATLQAQADARVVDAAIDKGKIMPSRRDHFMAMMKADRDGTTTLLNETLQEAAIPLTEMGHASARTDSGPTASTDLENPLYKGWMA